MIWSVFFLFLGALANFGVAANAVFLLGTGLTLLTCLNILLGVVLTVLAIRVWWIHD